MPYANFVKEQKSIFVEEGTTILEAARRGGVRIESPCNGNGTCGKCTVSLGSERGAASFREVPACGHRLHGDLNILVRDYADENQGLQMVSEGKTFLYEHHPFITKESRNLQTQVYGGGKLIGVEEGDTAGEIYGLAVDIGTTTLVAALVDLLSGKVLASESALNPQAVYAQDVLGRIHFASSHEGLQTLWEAFTGALETMIASLAQKTGVKREHIYEAVYAGNTTMLHLACNLDPRSLGQFPYTTPLSGGNHITGAHLRISPFALIWLPPVISAWIGADITSGILAVRLAEKRGVTLFIDIGTNGEMVLAKDGLLAAASAAAGPAFEGMNIRCGMRASRGAVESFRIEGTDFSFKVIGGDSAGEGIPVPRGICGSGLLDIAGELVRTGIVGRSGRFTPPEEAGLRGRLARGLRVYEGSPGFFITDEVYVTQRDIRQIQLAKGAIRCGVEMLLARFGLQPAHVDRVEIAGSFGYHLNEESLLHIGLLPPDFAGKVSFAGNTSLSGGIAFLMNAGFRAQMTALAGQVEQVELARHQDFENAFIKYLSF